MFLTTFTTNIVIMTHISNTIFSLLLIYDAISEIDIHCRHFHCQGNHFLQINIFMILVLLSIIFPSSPYNFNDSPVSLPFSLNMYILSKYVFI